jgi:phosphatidylserine decarboxylase
MRNQNTPIALEGLPFIAGFGTAALVLASVADQQQSVALALSSLILLLLALFSVFFFRNPRRTVPVEEGAVLAPADGVVVFLGEATEEHLARQMVKISIFMSVFNVHINRVPLSGKLVDNFYIRGKFLDVRDQRASFENERNGLVIETDRGLKVVVVQVAGLIARRIVCYPQVGELLRQGERYGLIRFGSRLDVFLPVGSDIRVALGDRTVGGETILGTLP